MAPLVLVHSPLVGPATWGAVAALLRRRGREVVVPDLTLTLTGEGSHWSRQAEVLADSAADQEAALVGHSGAGPLLGAAGAILDRVSCYVFVDARLPHPGRSLLESAPPQLIEQHRRMAVDGWLPPWSTWWGADGLAEPLPDPVVRDRFAHDCPRLPVTMFEEVQPPAPGWPDAPCGYLQLSEAYQDPADQARVLGWPVTKSPSHHLAMLTEPESVTDRLLDLVQELE